MTDMNAAPAAEDAKVEAAAASTIDNTVELAPQRPSRLVSLGKWALAGAVVGGAVVGGLALYNKFFGDEETTEPEA